MNYDLSSWSMGVNDSSSDSFWQKNKTKLYGVGLFGGLTIIGWLMGWSLLFRVGGLMLIIYVATNTFKMLGDLWKKLKEYMNW